LILAFVAADPQRFAGQVVGDGHCVAYVRAAANVPHTSEWRRGDPARGSNLASGTAIATFHDRGHYENDTTGKSHAAILIAAQSDGLLVWDQWLGTPVHQRVIRFRDGAGVKTNDGDAFHSIETEVAT
jgi:hypothetical protein